MGATTVALGDGSSVHKSTAATKGVSSVQKKLDRARFGLERAKLTAKKCHSLRCINGTLKSLIKAVNGLTHETIDCEQIANVTQYSDFVGSDGTNFYGTTGLDFTATGDAPSAGVLVYTC